MRKMMRKGALLGLFALSAISAGSALARQAECSTTCGVRCGPSGCET